MKRPLMTVNFRPLWERRRRDKKMKLKMWITLWCHSVANFWGKNQTLGKNYPAFKSILINSEITKVLLCPIFTDLGSSLILYGQYGNFRIFMLLRFYVKSILVIMKPQKLPFWPFEQIWIFNFWIFLTF